MKIGDPPKPVRPADSSRRSTAKTVDSSKTAASIDKAEFLGVPETELTPRVRTALMTLMAEVQDLRDEIASARQRIDELEKLAQTDPHLDIFNRRAFVRELNRALGMLDRYDVQVCLVFIDVNDLKKINDELGHAAGDLALKHASESITANVRQTDIVARLGGDEFAVLLYQVDREKALNKAKELATVIKARPMQIDGRQFTVSVSIGVVELPKGADVEAAMRLADAEMYKDKKNKPKR